MLILQVEHPTTSVAIFFDAQMGVEPKNRGGFNTPKSSHLFIGFSMK